MKISDVYFRNIFTCDETVKKYKRTGDTKPGDWLLVRKPRGTGLRNKRTADV